MQGTFQGFVAKLDATGKVVYSTFVGGARADRQQLRINLIGSNGPKWIRLSCVGYRPASDLGIQARQNRVLACPFQYLTVCRQT
jgi:hypothetical protein